MAEKLLMLALSPTMETGIIAKWLKKEGDPVESGDVLCEVETDKATMDYESPARGMLLKIVLPEGSSASIGDLIAIVGKEGEDVAGLLDEAPDRDKDDEELRAAPDGSSEPVRSSPLARKLAALNSLPLETIKGSGPAGRIVKADVDKALATAGAADSGQTDTVIPISSKRRVIAQRLSESMSSAPHYYLKVPVEMDAVMASRSRLNDRLDVKVSINAFLIKFVAEALKRHPAVNASWTGDAIVQHGLADIGLAVAQKDGLITPVVRDCGHKGIVRIDQELDELIQKARTNALKPEEYTGATFTISNLGSYGIEEFTAIINPPGSAILAVGEIRREPVVQPDDTIQVKSVMKLTLSCDHRVIDGSVGAEFLTDLRNMLEEPVRVLY
jgi:pyruvate dehydrogenase E2 component (dihydrolipoamide acetyltransferase)